MRSGRYMTGLLMIRTKLSLLFLENRSGKSARFFYSGCFSLFTMLFVFAAKAEIIPDTSDSGRIYELGVMVVRAPGMQIAAPERKITAVDIEDIGAQNAAEALKCNNGVIVSRGAKGETDIYLRGMNSQRILILVDGRPLNMPYYGKIDLNTITVDNVSGIVVTKGAPSLIYGVNGTAGTVNIITARPDCRDGYRLGAGVHLGENQTAGAATNGEIRKGKINVSASASRNISSGYSLSQRFVPTTIENGGRRDNSDYDRLNIFARCGIRFDAVNEAAISAGYYSDNRGVPPDVYTPQFRRFPQWKRYYADATGRMNLRNSAWMKAKLYYDNFFNELNQWTDAVNGTVDTANSPSVHSHWDAGGMTQVHIPCKGHDVCFAAGGKHETATTEGWESNPLSSFDMQTVSAAFEDAYAFESLPLVAEGGAGLSHVRSDGRSYAKGLYGKTGFDGRLVGRYSLPAGTSLYISAGTYTRYPTIRQLYGEEHANPSLREEKSFKAGAGGGFKPAAWIDAAVDFFYERYDDLIERRTIDGALAHVNIGKAVNRGIEAEINTSVPVIKTSLQGTYALTATEDKSNGRQLAYIPRHTIGANISQPLPGGCKSMLAFRRAINRCNESGYLMENYTVVDGRLSYRWRFLRASFGVENIFDENYTTDSPGYPMPGRTLRGDISVTLNRYFE
jgi:iron complex outermembrane receptor protein